MHIFTSEEFSVPLPQQHRFPMQKYHILRSLVEENLLGRVTLESAKLASLSDLELGHSKEYVGKILTGSLTRREVQKMGFPWSDNLVSRARQSVGATLAATQFAKKETVSISLAGGTHHARYEQASGFCLFNDVAIATIRELETNSNSRVLVIDCDVHQGDGTSEILLDYGRAYTLSIHSARNFPHKKANSDYDIELPDGTEDAEYLEKLSNGLRKVKEAFDPSLVFFNAGVDVHENDRLGRLKLSTEGLRRRDAMVYDFARGCLASLVAVMGGGYSSCATQIAELHYQTVAEAYRSWKSVNMGSEKLAK